MTEQTQFLLNQAVVAIKAGDLAGGRKLLESVLEIEPDNESAWLWMSAAVGTDAERRHCLEQVLRINPDNSQAKRGLEKLQPEPEPEPEKSEFDTLMADFAAFDTAKETPEEGASVGGESVPAFIWPLEPEQRDLAPETASEDVDLEALFKSFDQAAASQGTGEKAFEWEFDAPAGEAVEGEKPGGATPPTSTGEIFGDEESLNRFLGIEPPDENMRGFYEEDARQGKPVPAFTFGDETEGLDTSSEAFVSPSLPDTEFSFDIDQITGETPPPPAAPIPVLAAKPVGLLKLWTNPGGRANSVVILREEYLILANPDPLFIDRIREEVERGEVKKKSLGRTAVAIPLKSILRVQGELESSGFEVTYTKGKQKVTVEADFDSGTTRDEVMGEIVTQLGLGYQKVEENLKRSRLIATPVLTILAALIATPLLIYLVSLLFGIPDTFAVLSLGLILLAVITIGGVLAFAGGVILLILRLRQPLHLVTIVPADELGL